MVKSRFGQMILLGIQRFQDPYYQGFAAQMAFFYLLSIVPLIIVFSQLLDVFSISTELIEELLKRYAGGVIGDSVSEWLEGSGSVTTNIVLIATVLWSSSRAQFAMTRITNYTLTAGRSTGKGYFQERFRSIVTILITIFSLAFALIVIVFGEKILYVVLNGLEVMLNVKYEVDDVWMGLRWIFAFALYFLMVTLNYYIIPTERGRIRGASGKHIRIGRHADCNADIFQIYKLRFIGRQLQYPLRLPRIHRGAAVLVLFHSVGTVSGSAF